MLKGRLSIIIPTINRKQFMHRALKYYTSVGFDGAIIIGDSSEFTEDYVSAYPDLDIKYVHFDFGNEDSHHDAQKTFLLRDVIQTPYVTFAGDDDFQIPSGLEKCVEFLDNNPDYIAAHGHRINFTLDSDVYGNIIGLDMYDGYNWDTETPLQRWQEYMRKGIATTYYVHRTKNWKEYYVLSGDAKSNYLGNELIPCSICALSGKVKRLDCLSTAFQRDNPVRWFSFKTHTLWDLIHGKHWRESAALFGGAVIHLLSKDMTEDEANEIYHKEFWYHCLSVMNHQFNARYGKQEERPVQYLDMTKLPTDDPFYPIYQILVGDSGRILNDYLNKIKGLDILEGSTAADFQKLIELALSVSKPGMVAVEVGSWKGATAGAIGQVVKANGGILICIDPWENETVQIDHTDILEIFERNMKELGLEDTVKIIRKPSREGVLDLKNESVELLFLDGLHMYPYIFPDIQDYLPKVKKGGIISGHDLNVRYENINKEAQKEISENIHVNCVPIKALEGQKVHCGVAKAVYDHFNSDYQSSDHPMCSIWWRVK